MSNTTIKEFPIFQIRFFVKPKKKEKIVHIYTEYCEVLHVHDCLIRGIKF